MLYVANFGEDTVTVIDTFTSGMPVVGTVPVGRFPAGLFQDFAGGRLYVANLLDDTVSVIDTATLSVTVTIPVCARPRGLASAAGRVYVACFDDGQIDVIDPATNQVVMQAPSQGTNPVDLRADPDGQRLYVAHLDVGKSITVLDAATLVPLAAIEAPSGPVSFLGFAGQVPRSGPRRPDRPLETSQGRLQRRLEARATSGRRHAGALGDLVLLDTDFFERDWLVLNAAGDQGTSQQLNGGNPSAWRRTQHDSPGGADHVYAQPDGTYDPAVSGAVSSIDVSWDRRVETRAAVAESFVVLQGGLVYRTEPEVFFEEGWTSTGRTGLTAADFEDDAGGTPDFGANAGLLQFGYSRSVSAGFTLAHGIDNFLVTVHSAGGAGPGTLGFVRDIDVAGGEPHPIFVARVGGTQGAVGVDVVVVQPVSGAEETYPLAWADGEGSPKSVLVTFEQDETDTRTTIALLASPTGGATLDPTLMRQALFVVPVNWPRELSQWVVTLHELGALSPEWILALAIPLLGARRRRDGAREARS
jgi:YVTN family beta-propeller protein